MFYKAHVVPGALRPRGDQLQRPSGCFSSSDEREQNAPHHTRPGPAAAARLRRPRPPSGPHASSQTSCMTPQRPGRQALWAARPRCTAATAQRRHCTARRRRRAGLRLPSSARAPPAGCDAALYLIPTIPQEDAILIQMVEKIGEKRWPLIAAKLPGRTGKGCSHRRAPPRAHAHAQYAPAHATPSRALRARRARPGPPGARACAGTPAARLLAFRAAWHRNLAARPCRSNPQVAHVPAPRREAPPPGAVHRVGGGRHRAGPEGARQQLAL